MSDLQELTRQYESQADEELLRLALESEQLAPEAQLQLKAELARRGIDSPERLEQFRQDEAQATFDPTIYSKRGPGIASALRDWQRYHRQTGEWPIISVVAGLIQVLFLLGCLLFVFELAVQRMWSPTRFFLTIGAVFFTELWLWDRVRGKIRIKEIRSYRSRRGIVDH